MVSLCALSSLLNGQEDCSDIEATQPDVLKEVCFFTWWFGPLQVPRKLFRSFPELSMLLLHPALIAPPEQRLWEAGLFIHEPSFSHKLAQKLFPRVCHPQIHAEESVPDIFPLGMRLTVSLRNTDRTPGGVLRVAANAERSGSLSTNLPSH